MHINQNVYTRIQGYVFTNPYAYAYAYILIHQQRNTYHPRVTVRR
jgi:hypothetical protein